MRTATLLFAVVAALSVMPAAAGTHYGAHAAAREWIMVTGDSIAVQLDQGLPVSAADLRRDLDVDADGWVSAEEAAAYQLELTDQPVSASCAEGFAYARVGGAPPVRLDVERETRDLEGAVDGGPEIGGTFWVNLSFEADPRKSPFILRLGDYAGLARLASCATGHDFGLIADYSPPREASIYGWRDVWIQPDSLEPPWLRDNVDLAGFANLDATGTPPAWGSDSPEFFETNQLYLGQGELARAYQGEIRFLVGDKPPETNWWWTAAAAASTAAVGLALTEIGRVRIRSLLIGFGLFTRLTRERALDHRTRDAAMEFIQANPGATFSELRRHLAVGHGTLVHHLRVLETQGLVTTQRDAFRCRVFPKGNPLPSMPASHPLQGRIVEMLAARPGTSQQELAAELRLPRKNVSYHLGVLERRGLLRAEQVGRRRRYFATRNG